MSKKRTSYGFGTRRTTTRKRTSASNSLPDLNMAMAGTIARWVADRVRGRPSKPSHPYLAWASQVEKQFTDLSNYSVQMHEYAAAHPEDSAAQERAAQARQQQIQELQRWAADVRQLAARHPNDRGLREYAKQVRLTPARLADALAQAAARSPTNLVLRDYATKMLQHLAPPSRHIPAEVQLAVRERDGGRCVKCGSTRDLEFDHIIPWSQGGANTVGNIQLLCVACNRSKGTRA